MPSPLGPRGGDDLSGCTARSNSASPPFDPRRSPSEQDPRELLRAKVAAAAAAEAAASSESEPGASFQSDPGASDTPASRAEAALIAAMSGTDLAALQRALPEAIAKGARPILLCTFTHT